MDIKTLNGLLNVQDRRSLFDEIRERLNKLEPQENFSVTEYETSDNVIPCVKVAKNLNQDEFSRIKVFIGAQHNEYNGLFGILEFLEHLAEDPEKRSTFLRENQLLIFFPLMNPHGFLNPSKKNKSGYYLKNGSNLNRFWRRTFVPDYEHFHQDGLEFPIPEECHVVKKVLDNFWKDDHLALYFMDFHETSLLERFPRELSINLTLYYKFDHWLKEAIIENILDLYDIKVFRRPLFFQCNPSADHGHVNLTLKQLDKVFEKLHEYQKDNVNKLPFYFCYSDRSEEYAKKLSKKVYDELQSILWKTNKPAYDHHFHDHGCFVKMCDATTRKQVIALELESQKQFFNLFEEIEQADKTPGYHVEKLQKINESLILAKKAISEMILLD